MDTSDTGSSKVALKRFDHHIDRKVIETSRDIERVEQIFDTDQLLKLLQK